MSKRKPAILVVSYGCGYMDAGRRTLNRIEADIQAACPECPVCHAWTSGTLRRRLLEREGIRIPGVGEALRELLDQGIREAVVCPTHLLEGLENQSMTEEIQEYKEYFSRIVIGGPLLASDVDRKKVIQAVAGEIMLKPGEILVLMGHGSRTGAEEGYQEVDRLLQESGHKDILLGTMRGELNLENVLYRIRRRNPGRVLLAPFMITAGKHALEDLGGEKESSWKSRIEAAGYPVECILKGLGEYEGIRRIFAEHAKDSCGR